WWFLPWHRRYLYYFERIVRKMSGDDGFHLPYWAWEKEGQNVLPAPFREPKYAGQDNPLFDATRKEANKGKPLLPDGHFGSFFVDWEHARASVRFTTPFAELSYGGIRAQKTAMPKKPKSSGTHGVMESYAHDLVHDAVRGNMGDPRTAARDPIFWLHHANVDRLWNRWLEIQNHHLPDPVADKDWYDQTFPFYNENGTQVTMSVRQILELSTRESRYDDDKIIVVGAPPGNKEKTMKPKLVGVGQTQPKLTLGTKPFTKELNLDEDAKPG